MDRSNDCLFVKRPKVLDAAAAAGCYNHVRRCFKILAAANGRRDFLGRSRPLDFTRHDGHANVRPASEEDLQKISHGRAGGAGYHRNVFWESRQVTFVIFVEQAFTGKFGVQLLKC